MITMRCMLARNGVSFLDDVHRLKFIYLSSLSNLLISGLVLLITSVKASLNSIA